MGLQLSEFVSPGMLLKCQAWFAPGGKIGSLPLKMGSIYYPISATKFSLQACPWEVSSHFWLASRYDINGVIAMSTPYTISSDWRVRFAKQISFFLPFVKKGHSDTVGKKTSKDHIDYPVYPMRSIAELNELVETLHESIDQIRIPVLLINSKSDKTAPPSHAENYRRGISSNHFEMITLENSGHVITENIEREIVFNAALNFIQKYSKQ